MAVLLVAADQILKWLAIVHLKPVSNIPIIKSIIHLQYVENRGAAFGMLANNKFVLIGVTGLMIAGIIYIVVSKKIKNRMLIWALSTLVAGGLGNLIDRIFRGYVVDYIYFVPINFPVFNLADICVTVSTVLILIYILFIEPKEQKVVADK